MYCYVKGKCLLSDVKIADNFFLRFKGLMFKSDLHKEEGLLLEPCNGVHTFFMKFNLDILYLDKENKVIKTFYDIKPGKLLPVLRECRAVLETKAGNISRDQELINLKCEFIQTSNQ